ncbi:MAG: TfoX/Sxy family protein [Niabella sp.]
MAFDVVLAERIRIRLQTETGMTVEEKKMFGGLALMVNGKMCINISGDKLMCRFDPAIQEVVAQKKGFEKMVMRGKKMNGYCYVTKDGFKNKKDFEYWVNLCLAYNKEAPLPKSKKK